MCVWRNARPHGSDNRDKTRHGVIKPDISELFSYGLISRRRCELNMGCASSTDSAVHPLDPEEVSFRWSSVWFTHDEAPLIDSSLILTGGNVVLLF